MHAGDTIGGLSMRIIQVCHRYYPYIGGVETHVREISERLTKRFDVEVLTTDPFGGLLKEEIIAGVKVKRFKSWAPRDSYHFSGGLEKYLAKNSEKCHIMHAHSYHDFPALYAAKARKSGRFIFTPHYHGSGHTFFRSLFHKPYKLLGRKIFEKADKIICVSKHEKSLVKKHFEIADQKIKVIPNGVNLKEFDGLEKKVKNSRIILYVGRLEKYKNVNYLIRTLPKLNEDIVLEIVGEGSSKRRLLELVRKLDLEDRVTFYHNLARKELLQKYVDADLFVLLSKHEAYGISVAEALASRTPCIVANDSALMEWVDGKKCFGIGFPINVDKVAELIDKVIGRTIKDIKLTSWDEAVERLLRVYISDDEDP